MTGYVDILLPSVVDAVVGKEFNLFTESIIATERPLKVYQVTYDCIKGKTGVNGFYYTPSETGNLSVYIAVWDGPELAASKTLTVKVHANTGTVRKVLVHADSNFEQPGLDMKKTIVSENPGAFTFVGERTKDDDETPIKHEANYGWSLGQYLIEGDMNTYYKANVTGLNMQMYALLYTGSAQFQLVRKVLDVDGDGYVILLKYNGQALPSSGTLIKGSPHAGDSSFAYTGGELVSGNPFWNGGSLNVTTYLTRNSITLGANDAWVIHLGTNGLQFHTSDTEDTNFAAGFASQVITMKNAIRAAAPAVNILLCITIPCSSLPDALQSTNTLFRYNKAWRALCKSIISTFDTPFYIADKVKVVALNAGLDRVYGFPHLVSAASSRETAAQTLKSTDAIHMGASGQQQAADVLLAALRGI